MDLETVILDKVIKHKYHVISLIGGGNGNPLQYSCLEKSHGQRSLAGYSPWGHKGLYMT